MWYIHILVPIILAIILNFYIYIQGWNNDNQKNSKLPPGYIIGSIWIIILGLLGYIHFLLYPSVYSWFIVLTILYCLSYPFLTSGLQNTDNNYFNLIALILAIIVTIIMYYKSNIIYVIPFLLWTFYVNIILNVF
jgi:tryptophan-rich sensory protein